MTYSPLLLATEAGWAAATAVLFSLAGTKLQQAQRDACYVDGVLGSSVLTLVLRKNSPGDGILAFCTVMKTLLLGSKY